MLKPGVGVRDGNGEQQLQGLQQQHQGSWGHLGNPNGVARLTNVALLHLTVHREMVVGWKLVLDPLQGTSKARPREAHCVQHSICAALVQRAHQGELYVANSAWQLEAQLKGLHTKSVSFEITVAARNWNAALPVAMTEGCLVAAAAA
eukprot:CAMPEP_0172930594 /NCGR_PEP_ID=MMETSP1075-20121228/219063_1 /TAXON_ID=2916 /ORGANISM="Ceratium fusus, Strain PA161109" /LENGTH=147 /DNA_ID=CAMNT_0013791903 /DNA_START=1587 /DNA_END=2030 /DNA_ORIENTATION=-